MSAGVRAPFPRSHSLECGNGGNAGLRPFPFVPGTLRERWERSFRDLPRVAVHHADKLFLVQGDEVLQIQVGELPCPRERVAGGLQACSQRVAAGARRLQACAATVAGYGCGLRSQATVACLRACVDGVEADARVRVPEADGAWLELGLGLGSR